MTLVLRVLGRRKDGYHDVQIGLAPVSLYDTLDIRVLSDKGLLLEVDSNEDLGPIEANLVFRAAQAVVQASAMKCGFHLRLHKRIPTGAGLGGGSGNAAGTLVACNRFTEDRFTRDRLLEEAVKLGSDVPFFVRAIPAWAEGRGERLRPLLDLPRLNLLVVKPAFSIKTSLAYELLSEFRTESKELAARSLPRLSTVDEVVAALHNAFEPVLFRSYPELKEIKARLLEEGALGAVLTGSGSALFGIFTTSEARNLAGERFALEDRWVAMPCETLVGHAYEPES